MISIKYNIIEPICMFFKRIYWKIKYGFSIEDTWNIDYGICKWLLPRLKYFKNHLIGFPVCNDLNGNPMTLDTWKYYLSLIEYWAKCIVNNDEPIYVENINKSFGTKFPDIVKNWKSKENKIAKRTFDLGEKCFFTYFHNLWN